MQSSWKWGRSGRRTPLGYPKMDVFELEQRGPRETLEERTWITHGQDLVNVQSFYLVAETVEIAKAWRIGINAILKNCKTCHSHKRSSQVLEVVNLSVNDRRKIPIKLHVGSFASGKLEKVVLKCLSHLGLCGDKKCHILLSVMLFLPRRETYRDCK